MPAGIALFDILHMAGLCDSREESWLWHALKVRVSVGNQSCNDI